MVEVDLNHRVRPHDAPSMAFYSLGNFDKSVTVPRHIQPVAAPVRSSF